MLANQLCVFGEIESKSKWVQKLYSMVARVVQIDYFVVGIYCFTISICDAGFIPMKWRCMQTVSHLNSGN